MDKVELGIKLEQINELKQNGDYKAAAKVADTIEWRKVKKWSELSTAQEVYIKAGRPADARNVCVHAYNRNLGGKRLVYTLAELSIQINDLDEAEDLYNEYVEMAPNDMERYVLLYKLNKAKGESIDKLISILEEYKRNELDEKYEYELASLYAQAGRTDDCVKECDDLILWFNDGDYVEKALRLKAQYAELTKSQKSKLSIIEEYRAAGVMYETILPDYDEGEEEESNALNEPSNEAMETKEDYEPPEKDYSVYDTQNVQAELAKQMAVILAGQKPLQEDIQPAADLMSNINSSNSVFPEIAREAEEAKEKAKETEKEAEEKGTAEEPKSVEPDVSWKAAEPGPEIPIVLDEIDEPTKEIRVNTHHWNAYKNVMSDEQSAGNEEKQLPDGSGLPKYMTEETITEGEADTAPDYVITNIETVVDETGREEEKAEEVKKQSTAAVPVDVTDSVMDGQMDIMAWLEMADAETEEAPASEECMTEADNEPDYENNDGSEAGDETEAATDPESDETAKDETVNEDSTPDTEKVSELNENRGFKVPRSFDTQDIEDALNRVQQKMMLAGKQGAEEDIIVEEVMNDVADILQKEVEKAAKEQGAGMEAPIEVESGTEASSDSEVSENEPESENAETETVPENIEAEAVPEEEPEAEDEYSAASEDSDDESPVTKEQESEDKERNDFVLKEEEKKYLGKYLFINGLEENAASIINQKKRENSDKTASHGNVAVIGNPKTDKTDFAINFIKALHATSEEKALKIAKTSASAINNSGIGDIADKVKDMTLIVENAGQLTKKASQELSGWMEKASGVELVVITGEELSIKRLFEENPKLAGMFEHRIKIRHYTVNELVAVAKEYARVKGYIISDKALLKVYLMISEIESLNDGNEIEKVRNIVSDAISRNTKTPKSSKKLIPLKEKNFVDNK